MSPSRRPIWFCAVVAVVGVGLLPVVPVFGVLWCCLWGGLAVLFVAARRRFPGFVPVPAAASLQGLGLRDSEIEGPIVVPSYILVLIGSLWSCTMLVPLMSTAPGVLPSFGVAIGLVLGGGALWLHRRQGPSANVAAALVGRAAPGTTVVLAKVEGPPIALRRHIHWFQLAGMRHGTQSVETRDGSTVTVATVTPTSTTYGFVDEQRRLLRLVSDDGVVKVQTEDVRWAAGRRPLPEAPPLPKAGASRNVVLESYVALARVWEEESIGAGDQVLVAGAWDPDTRRITAPDGGPVLVFGVEPGHDPIATLRAELWRRRWP
ncbi:MAG: hypothetical protein K0V04_16840, partial [Deltaproteobacteria bacterium]|nr:hypothetical protein [Deltaproteobacteria bacterium]